MSSLIYNSFLYNIFRSIMNFNTDSFKVMLVTDMYIPNKEDMKRSDITREIMAGDGYVQGGISVNVNISKDNTSNRINITLGEAVWNNSTITASSAIYYRVSNNGSANDDLVCCIEFDDVASCKNGSFTVTPSIIRVQN